MNRKTLTLALTLTAVAAAAGGAHAQNTNHLAASLNLAQAIPRPTHVSGTATGSFKATLSGHTLTWRLSYSGISQRVTATYLDYGTKTETGAVLLAICAPCNSPAHGTTKVTPAEIKDIQAGRTYLNLETFQHPRGLIRGQLG
jgi:hypothetical protein